LAACFQLIIRILVSISFFGRDSFMGRSKCFIRQEWPFAAGIAALAVTIGMSGCGDGKSKPSASAMATISGSVTINAKPIAQDSHVIFFCADKGATAAGKIDALGKFSLQEADPTIGIPAGRYQVMIRPPDPPPMKMGTDDYKKMMGAGAAPGSSGVPPQPVEKPSEIPAKYQDFVSSTLALEVKVGANTFDIDLAKLEP
jgi:hypothetical protein